MDRFRQLPYRAGRAAAAIELLDELIHSHGQLRRRDQEMLAGERVLNNDRDLLPRMSRATSLGLSLYLGNRRIACSSVLDAGDAMEVGGFADATVVDAVLRRREVFRGFIDIAGRRTMVAARPLYDQLGAVAGDAGLAAQPGDLGVDAVLAPGVHPRAVAVDDWKRPPRTER